jgi:adenylate cyclase
VDQLLDNPELLKLGGEERVLSILFADIVNFTSISETMKPGELVSLLNEYLTNMTDIILAEGGTIDKYIGDAILAEFGVPIKMENHASAAVRTALLSEKKIIIPGTASKIWIKMQDLMKCGRYCEMFRTRF